tara:strand:- start:2158 stop:3798 length:1641 start_codon:yes stop_codon:yes gene_type:complete
MKTTMTQFRWILICLLFTGLTACSPNEDDDSGPGPGDGEVEQSNGISEDDLENYAGDLGILINSRELVKKGYSPAKVNLSTEATEGNYDQQIDIDTFTGMAQLYYAVDGLSDAAADELRNGIAINIQILNASGAVIVSESYSTISFEENGNQIDIDASSLVHLAQTLDFAEGVNHYIQNVNANGNYGNSVVWKPSSALMNNVLLEERTSSFNRGTTTEQYLFYKFPGTINTFAIWSANSGRYLATDSNDQTFRQSGAVSYPTGISDNSLHPRYRFIIKKETNGLYTINDMQGNPMRRFANGGKIKWRTNGTGSIQYVRIIALDLNWDAQELDTRHLTPIFPSVDTSFGFNSTLRNCGSGSLEQQVGVEREVETTYTSSFSESIGLSGRVTTSVDVSVSATAEASFFGNGGSVTGEVSAGLEVSVEASSTTTVESEESVSESEVFFSNRTVTVPAGSASLVYDAYQTYSNVRVPYVKRLRLKGNHSEAGQQSLTGLEIATQLRITGFSGTITNVGSDFVEITIQGNMYLDNIVDTQTEVRDVAANCD